MAVLTLLRNAGMGTKWVCIARLSWIVLVGLLPVGCLSNPPASSSAVGSPSAAPRADAPMQSSSPSGVIAKIAEIYKPPVFVRPVNATQEKSAAEGMAIAAGETVRTQGQALAQVDLNNGLAFRIGGDAVLTLQPNSRLNLTSGDMITWVQPGKKVPAEIVTPAAIAGIRGTTVYVKIPKNSRDGILFFAWEGAVSVRLPNQPGEVLLKTAEEVRIQPGERDLQAIRQRVRRLSQQEWRQQRSRDRLLHSFRQPLPTLPIINRIKPGQVSLNE